MDARWNVRGWKSSSRKRPKIASFVAGAREEKRERAAREERGALHARRVVRAVEPRDAGDLAGGAEQQEVDAGEAPEEDVRPSRLRERRHPRLVLPERRRAARGGARPAALEEQEPVDVRVAGIDARRRIEIAGREDRERRSERVASEEHTSPPGPREGARFVDQDLPVAYPCRPPVRAEAQVVLREADESPRDAERVGERGGGTPFPFTSKSSLPGSSPSFRSRSPM
jgi:hypothetical protein